jgi:hypothetical protein
MKVNITKDYWNGEKSKIRTIDIDGFSMSQLAFLLLESGVAGITITQVETLETMIKRLTKPTENKTHE